MGRQSTAIAPARARFAARLTLDNRLGFFLCGVEHALGDLHILQRQVVLLGAKLFRFRAELVALQFTDDALQPAARLLRLSQRGLRLRQQRLQARVLLGKGGDIHAPFRSWLRRSRHGEDGSESLGRSHPASRGRRLRSGRTNRHSSPSNRAANWVGDIFITPSRTCGQTNLQPSSRLWISTRPV